LGIFGKLTSRGDDGLTFLDRAAIFAKSAEGDTGTAMAYRGSIADRMKRQQQQEFMAQLAGRLQGTAPTGPTYAPTNNEINVGMGGEGNASTWSPEASINPVRTSDGTPGTPGLNINSPDLLPLILGAPPGTNVAPILDVLKAQAPKYGYERGQRVQLEGAGSGQGPAFIADMDKGMRPGADGGVEMLPNYDRVAGQIAGTVESAKSGAQAAFDLVDVPDGAGGSIKMPRAIAAQILAGKSGGMIGGGAPPNIGRTLPQAQLAADQARAVGAVEKDLERPARIAALDEQDSALREMKALLPDVVAGFGSDVQLQTQRALAAFGNEDAKRKVAATETFINQGRVLVSQIIKSFGANPTEGERKYAEKMAGADAELNPATLAEGIRLAEERSARERARLQGSTPPPSRTALEAEMRRRGLMR
jgi:hypothetical protein